MYVSFVSPVRPLLLAENTRTGGLVENALKLLNGAKFTFPSLSTVLTKAIGLGATEVSRKPCVSCKVRFFVSKDWKVMENIKV
jgi:hypothetical protein